MVNWKSNQIGFRPLKTETHRRVIIHYKFQCEPDSNITYIIAYNSKVANVLLQVFLMNIKNLLYTLFDR